MITNRITLGSAPSSWSVAVYAALGAAYASPVRTAAGIASASPRPRPTPNTTMTTVKITDASASRTPIHAMSPVAISPRPDRRGQHRVVVLDPLDAGQHGPRRFGEPELHGLGGEEAGGQELEIVDAVDLLDERAQAQAHGGQVEDRAEEGGEDRRPPQALVRQGLALDHPEHHRRRHVSAPLPYSTRVRPVRWRKTSSSELRRTRAVSGMMPRSWAATSAASPSALATRSRSGSTSMRSPMPSS